MGVCVLLYDPQSDKTGLIAWGRCANAIPEDQFYRASGLNLVIAAIVLWNTVYLEKAVDYLKEQGMDIPEEYLQHLSPLGWEHINLTGDYVWNLKQATSFDKLRSLRVKENKYR